MPPGLSPGREDAGRAVASDTPRRAVAARRREGRDQPGGTVRRGGARKWSCFEESNDDVAGDQQDRAQGPEKKEAGPPRSRSQPDTPSLSARPEREIS